MTDVLDRLDSESAPSLALADDVDHSDQSARNAFAVVSASAAAIHLAMAPPHIGDSAVLGIGFVLAAWAGLATAWLAVTHPSKRLWLGAIALNVAFLATWAISRTAGLPFGEHAGHPESMTIVDLTTVALEVAALLLALRLLLLHGRRSLLLGVGVPVLALVAASVALASPDARTHAHGDAADGHAHAAASPQMAALTAKGFGEFMNGHEHAHVEVALDPATQAELDRQLAVTRDVAAQYPTIQSAIDDGYQAMGPYTPGLGLHLIKFGGEYLNPDGIVDDADLRHPLALMYDSEDADAELAGFMYYSLSAVEPAGFAGRNDGWHYHEDLSAVTDATGRLTFPFGPDHGATPEQCDGVGGNILKTQWMVHVWSVDGYDDMADYGGVYAEMNPQLACSDGTWFSLPFERWGENAKNTCVSGASGRPEL